MNQPRIYMCSPSRFPVPPPSPSHPSGSSQCTSPEHPVSCIEPGLAICFTYDNIRVSMLFSQIIPQLAFSHRAHKSVLYICKVFPLICIPFSLWGKHWMGCLGQGSAISVMNKPQHNYGSVTQSSLRRVPQSKGWLSSLRWFKDVGSLLVAQPFPQASLSQAERERQEK